MSLKQTSARDGPLDGGVDACTKFGGHRPLKIWEGKKRPKFGAI